MATIYEIKQKEVINIRDGCRFGFVADLEIDISRGKICKIIVSGPAKMFGIFGSDQEYHISWDCIRQIGEDIILVDIDTEKALVDCDD